MITKMQTLVLLIGGLALAMFFAYYLNMRVDHKAVIAFLKSKIR